MCFVHTPVKRLGCKVHEGSLYIALGKYIIKRVWYTTPKPNGGTKLNYLLCISASSLWMES